MSEFNFNSQPATSIEQSKRLLALGLKKETADCYWFYCDIAKEWKCTILSSTRVFRDYPTTTIPAWSLYRLIEIMPRQIECEVENGLSINLFPDYDAVAYYEVPGMGYYTDKKLYNSIIYCIEHLIKEGHFNKEYLEE